jgi:hypothetical protein
MLLSQKHRILYIANPKTATTAVQKWMLSEDSSFEKTLHRLNGKEIILKEHITALEAKNILGEEYYNQLFVIGFVREPISKIMSAYNFYKQGGKNKKLWDKNTKTFSSRFIHLLQYVSAKILPFELWLLIYPFKDNISYFLDTDENLIVRNIGRFEFLKEDLHIILKRAKINLNIESLKVANRSNKTKNDTLSPFFLKLLEIRHPLLRKDIKLYQKIQESMKDENSH